MMNQVEEKWKTWASARIVYANYQLDQRYGS